MHQDAPPAMTPINAYLLRALLGWIEDNHLTPHILVNGMAPGVRVPQGTIRDGKVVLNMSGGAIDRLEMSDYHVGFMTRFGGRIFEVSLPMASILSVYAKENSQGMQLPLMADPVAEPPGNAAPEAPIAAQGQGKPASQSDRRAHLRVVK